MKLLLASHNKNKLVELKYLLGEFNMEIVSSADFNLSEPVEDGDTFEANALIKAKQSAEQTGLLSLSDDSGFAVEAIGGQPGVYSARWAVDGNYSVAFERIQKLLAEANTPTRAAKFVSVLCLYNPTDKSHKFFRGEVLGEVVFPPRGNNGFAYDTVFIPLGHNKTFAEMSFEEKNSMSHRNLALAKLKEYFNSEFPFAGEGVAP
ncbi:MAG: RdgB/HAM1 family non-canonical purine NTP pyrophosphatase [Alphaproteobacteria bacterium]|jgi:XTP/dITP diphosphohydrolase|nr:RdgB/HAM1 family non-canonical purine NTP pyrophosphatase [Alphaproteobacteria bacterium]